MAHSGSKPAAPAAAELPYRLEDQVGHVLRRAHQRATAHFQAHIGDPRITPTQFAALVELADGGELSQNHLGRLTAMDPATVQGVTRRLIDRGLIATRPDPNDRRRNLLRLTSAGTALVERLIPNGFRVSDAILEPLSPADRALFLDLLKKLT
ncbi:MAG: MarR family winged helix-turn-helix transcriptional regulator [Alphaproteobacteria bacterium]|jgi:DNA-binding MarR family transcriptional regulator|nr:MarR family winged helix-turn-helix transcriptional regulator [Alphaproteobacteria bacterium]MDP6516683.1 MarR family winged helix-turn-helix transcriptional regulator [Alphaproteobacteria bacterium]